MKDLNFNKLIIASLCFLPALFGIDDILDKAFWLIVYGVMFFLCLYSLTIKRKEEALYKYYLFKILALVYMLSVSYVGYATFLAE